MSDNEVKCDGFRIVFSDAIRAFKFDENDNSMPDFHGAPMKAVDVVAEFESAYVFVEIKDYEDEHQRQYDPRLPGTDDETAGRRRSMTWLKNYLKYKFRDSFLFRHAEGKVDKPIHYVCLLTFDNGLNHYIAKQLKPELPTGQIHRRWIGELAKSCHVLNVARWNKNYPKWPLEKLISE